jgi:hypothetical protein
MRPVCYELCQKQNILVAAVSFMVMTQIKNAGCLFIHYLKTIPMAKQRSIIKLEGTIGDITFFKSKDGYIAREKTSISKDRIQNDPAFQRTRENGAEFGRAGKAGKVLRGAFRTVLQDVSDNRMISRLTKEMMRVVQADTVNSRGMRNVIDGEAELLEGFEFNEGGKLGSSLFAPFTATLNRVTGEATVTVPSFIPLNMIVAPGGTTHYQFMSAGAEINFETETYTTKYAFSGVELWNDDTTTAANLSSTLTPNSTLPLFLVFGIKFFQEVNGTLYALRNGTFNALQMAKVLGV